MRKHKKYSRHIHLFRNFFINICMLFNLFSNTQTNNNGPIKDTEAEYRLDTFYFDPFIQKRILALVKEDFAIKFTGYVQEELFFATRRASRNITFPARKILDPTGKDLNAKGSLLILPFQSRLRTLIKGPPIQRITPFGFIEINFLATQTIENIARMRHAFIMLRHEKVLFILGQTWHPMIVFGCYPRTVSNNGGNPIEPFSRNPQLRIVYRNKSFKLIAAAISQVDFTNDGPRGFTTSYLRDAAIPNLNAHVQILVKRHLIGAGFDFKRLVPRLRTDKNFKANEQINSLGATAYICLNWGSVIWRTKAIFMQNGSNLNMLGGFAVDAINPVTDQRCYTNISCAAIWTDFSIIRPTIESGIFIGYIKNLGASNTIIPDAKDSQGNIVDRRVFGVGTDVNNVIRISPRLRWFTEKIMVAGEIEYTRAAYGTRDNKGRVQNTTPVSNTRLFGTIYYFF